MIKLYDLKVNEYFLRIIFFTIQTHFNIYKIGLSKKLAIKKGLNLNLDLYGELGGSRTPNL